jgi:hypothetical protein
MKSFESLLKFTYEQKKLKNWSRLYWAIDLHDTIIEGKYNKFNEGALIFPRAKEVLDYLYKSDVHRTILWTSSYDAPVQDILKRFDLKFHYFNENPECPNSELCDFGKKFYFNMLLDDKAGFDGNVDWITIESSLRVLDGV